MALPSFFKRTKTGDGTVPAAAGPSVAARAGRRGAGKPLPEASSSRAAPLHESATVLQARIHARRRLIGAAVLLLLGVLLFPLVFETQPRPLPLDLPMTVAPGKGTAAAVPAPAPVTTPVTAPMASTAPRPAPPMIIETAEPEPRPAPAAASAVAQASPSPAAPAAPPATVAAPKPTPAPTTASAPAPEPGRFVVQVGAFADDATVRQTRQKVEKLGLKTYTQEVNTEAGKRVRIRVGPFATRDEAAQVLGKLKGAGLPGAVLTL
jgi:DedD protein